MKRCRDSGGRPATSVANQLTIAAKTIAMLQRKSQTMWGIASSSRKKTVSRLRRRSSSTTSWTGCESFMPGIYDGYGGRTLLNVAIDKETADRIEQPIAAEAEPEARVTPAKAIERVDINVPARGNRNLRTIDNAVTEDRQL